MIAAPISDNLQKASVKKHVGVIHIGAKLGLTERKLFNVLLVNAYDALDKTPVHSIDLKLMCAMLGFDSRNAGYVKECLSRIVETSVTFNVLGDGDGSVWSVSSLLASARIEGGVCHYEYSREPAAKLYHPEIYATIQLKAQHGFKNSYALALYENCFRFRKVLKTSWWSLEDFKTLIGLDPKSVYYSEFKQLKAKRIMPDVREVNRVSPILITPEFRRKGRRIAGIRFLIKDNPQYALPLDDEDGLRQTPLYRRLRDEFEIADKLALKWLADHGEAYVAAKIKLAEQQLRAGRIASTVSGFLVKTVQDDYKSAEEQARVQQSQARDRRAEAQAARDRLEQVSELRRAIEADHRKRAQSAVTAFLDALPEDDRERRLAAVRAACTPSEAADFEKRGAHSLLAWHLVSDAFAKVIADAAPSIETIAAEHGVTDWPALLAEEAALKAESSA